MVPEPMIRTEHSRSLLRLLMLPLFGFTVEVECMGCLLCKKDACRLFALSKKTAEHRHCCSLCIAASISGHM